MDAGLGERNGLRVKANAGDFEHRRRSPDLVVEDWTGFDVKAGTPSATVGALNSAINIALNKPNVRSALANLGATPAGGTSDAFGEFVKSEMPHWAQVVKDAGLKVQQ